MNSKTVLKIKRESVGITILFVIFFTLSYMSSLTSFLFKTNIVLYSVIGFSLVLAFLLRYRRNGMRLYGAEITWIFIFLYSLINNGDIERSSYTNSLYFLIGIFIPLCLVNYDFEHIALKIMTWFSFIHLFFGLFFLAFPNLLINNIDMLYSLSYAYYSKLVGMINNGYMVGITSHYSTEGNYMAIAFILFCTNLFYGMLNKKKIKFTLIMSVAFLTGIFLTGKRAQLLFSVIALCILYLISNVFGDYNRRIKQILGFSVAFIIVFAVCLNIPAFNSTIQRFLVAGDADTMSSGRVNGLWIPALNKLKNNMLFGIGWRQFRWQCPQLQGGSYVNNDTHNIYLQLLCECGIIIGTLIIIFMIYNLVLTIKEIIILKKHKVFNRTYRILMFALCFQLFFMFYGATGNPLYEMQTFYPYMLCCAVSYKYSYIVRKN